MPPIHSRWRARRDRPRQDGDDGKRRDARSCGRRRSTASSAVLVASWRSAHDAALAEIDVRELRRGNSEVRSAIGRDTVVHPRPISAIVYSKPLGISIRARCSAPVTGFLIGSPRPWSRRARPTGRCGRRCPPRIRLGAKIGSCSFSSVVENTWKMVAPGSVSCPLRMRNSASRCASVARSSMTTAASPLPSWIGPGQRKMPTNLSPSSRLSP